MNIVVSIASPDPPVGHVIISPGRTPTAFVGWLGLIRLLADAVASDGNAAAVRTGQPHALRWAARHSPHEGTNGKQE